MSLKKILVVINPISGGEDKREFPAFFVQNIDATIYKPEIYWWEGNDDLYEKLKQFCANQGWAVVAVGGDGTVNFVANAIQNSGVHLIIVPTGSGNGLARQLEIPLLRAPVMEMLNTPSTHKESLIDLGRVGDSSFINIAGLGFDAAVAHKFAERRKRRIVGYFISTLKLFWKSSEMEFTVSIDGRSQSMKGFMINVANGSQWGNNYVIAHKAFLNDGYLDLVVVRKPRWYQIPSFIYALRKGKDHHLIVSWKGEEIRIELRYPWLMHVDGEPLGHARRVKFTVKPGAVSILSSHNWTSRELKD